MKVHPTITLARIMDACERSMTTLDNPGFCIACGEDAEGVEPDAEQYKCEYCRKEAVYGAEQLLLMAGGLA